MIRAPPTGLKNNTIQSEAQEHFQDCRDVIRPTFVIMSMRTLLVPVEDDQYGSTKCDISDHNLCYQRWIHLGSIGITGE